MTIAGISTTQLVVKDFVTEPSEERMRKAGHLMGQKLAGSLALVTCKEPLKTNMAAHLRQFLGELGLGDVSFLAVDSTDNSCHNVAGSSDCVISSGQPGSSLFCH